MQSKIRGIPVKMSNGKSIGTAELEVDSDATAAWLEVVLHKETAMTLHRGLETLQYAGITLDAAHPPVEVNRHGVGYVPPIDSRLWSDVRIKDGSTPPVDPTHPHYADFDLDPRNRSLGEEEINSRFGFHKATIEGPNATAPRHAYLRNEFKTFADMLDRVLPPGRYKNLVMTSLEEASMWSHKSIAEKAPAGE